MASTTLPPETPILARAGNDHGGPAAPDGLHPAVCCDVIDLGQRTGPWGERHKVKVVWQLGTEDANKRRYLVSRMYTLSLAPKATLRRDLESWRGKAFTSEELDGFNLLKLIGANCQLQTVATVKDGGQMYANVQAIVPPPRTMPRLIAANYTRERERAQPRGNPAPPTMGPEVNRVPF